MTQHMPMEALLRPPVELYSAALATGSAGLVGFAPWVLMLPTQLGWGCALVLLGFAGMRARQALFVLRYQRGLKHTKITQVAPHKIPVGPDELYLGEGFEWTQLHTQRKHDAHAAWAREYAFPSARDVALRKWGKTLQQWGAAHKAHSSFALRALALTATGASSSAKAINPIYPHINLGGSPILHGVGGQERPVSLQSEERGGNLLVLGTPGSGKTRLLELLVTQDIHAGHVVIVVDPKGDADLMLRVKAECARAGRECLIFHLGYPDISARYNGIGSFSRITEVATRTTNALPSSGNSAAFKEFSWRFTNIVAQALVALGRIPTYASLLQNVTRIDPLFLDYAQFALGRELSAGRIQSWQARWLELQAMINDPKQKRDMGLPRALQDREPALAAMVLLTNELNVNNSVLSGLSAAVSYERSFYEKIIASLGPFLEKLTTGHVAKLISPDYFDESDARPIFDWYQVIRQNGVVYVGLDALSDMVVAGAVGNSILADLLSIGGKLYKQGMDPHSQDGKLALPTVCLHTDEVNEICGPEFVPMVNKLRGSGFRITAYTQSLFDFEAKMADRAKARQIIDNFNHLVMLRVRSKETASLIADQVAKVDVVSLTQDSGASDAAGSDVDYTVRNGDRVSATKVELISAADILSLPKGQAFAMLNGNRAFKIRIPLADTRGDKFVPESLRKVAQDMRARYAAGNGLNWQAQGDWMAEQPLFGAGANLVRSDLAPVDGGA
jgi:conjugative coupling factor TraD (TOL family)